MKMLTSRVGLGCLEMHVTHFSDERLHFFADGEQHELLVWAGDPRTRENHAKHPPQGVPRRGHDCHVDVRAQDAEKKTEQRRNMKQRTVSYLQSKSS